MTIPSLILSDYKSHTNIIMQLQLHCKFRKIYIPNNAPGTEENFHNYTFTYSSSDAVVQRIKPTLNDRFEKVFFPPCPIYVILLSLHSTVIQPVESHRFFVPLFCVNCGVAEIPNHTVQHSAIVVLWYSSRDGQAQLLPRCFGQNKFIYPFFLFALLRDRCPSRLF